MPQFATKEALSAHMRRIRKTDTRPELAVRRLVHGMGYRYRLHRRDLPGTPDLVFPARAKVIFVHGCFWHQHECALGGKKPSANPHYWHPKLARNVERDAQNCKRLLAQGWDVLVVWECEVKDSAILEDRLRAYLDNPSPAGPEACRVAQARHLRRGSEAGERVHMLKAISLYTGIGGLDFGFEVAGFRTAVAIDMDPVACRMIRLNRNWTVLEGDIDQISSDTILRTADLKAGEADVLIGGPPCQPFSKSGYWANGDVRRLDDPRADTLTAYLRVLCDTKPRAFLLENVLGLAYKGKDEGLQHLKDGLEEVNRQAGTRYEIHWIKLNAAGFGVPQIRERVFLIGSRDGRPFAFPEYTHGEARNGEPFENGLEPYRTAWDAIGDLPASPDDPALALRGKWADLLPSIPEGQNYLWHTNRGGGKPLFG